MINSNIKPPARERSRRQAGGGEPPPRFLVAPDSVRGEAVYVRGPEGHHARRVLRLEKGDAFVAVDGRGAEYEAVVHIATADGLVGRIVRTTRRSREPIAQVTLAVPMLRPAKLAQLVAEATALGARGFVLFECARAPKREPSPLELAHLNAVAAAAMKQSLRSVLPAVTGPKTWGEVLQAAARFELAFICRRQPAAEPLAATLGPRKPQALNFLVAVGPPGGFEPAEEEDAAAVGLKPLDLGPRRLRTEQAATTACTLILHAMGDLGPAGPR